MVLRKCVKLQRFQKYNHTSTAVHQVTDQLEDISCNYWYHMHYDKGISTGPRKGNLSPTVFGWKISANIPPHFFVALNTAMSMNLLGKSNMFTYSEKDRVIIAAKLEQKAAVANLLDWQLTTLYSKLTQYYSHLTVLKVSIIDKCAQWSANAESEGQRFDICWPLCVFINYTSLTYSTAIWLWLYIPLNIIKTPNVPQKCCFCLGKITDIKHMH